MALMLTWRFLLTALALGAPPVAFADPATRPAVETLPAADVAQTSVTLRGWIRPRGQVAQYSFEWGTTTAYGNSTPLQATPNPGRPVDVRVPLGQLAAGTTYHYRLVARTASDTVAGGDVQFTTAPGPASAPGGREATPPGSDPAPRLGATVVVRPVSGVVFVRRPRARRRFVLGAGRRSIPVGSIIDARNGRVELVTALAGGGRQRGVFSRGRFQVRQPRRARGRTDLLLRGGSFRTCPQRSIAVASRVAQDGPRRVVRRLWGRTRGGRFRTHGRDSVATVRGTRWATIDRCDGTLTRVAEGAVSVRDRHKRKTVLVTAGQTYLARRAR